MKSPENTDEYFHLKIMKYLVISPDFNVKEMEKRNAYIRLSLSNESYEISFSDLLIYCKSDFRKLGEEFILKEFIQDILENSQYL